MSNSLCSRDWAAIAAGLVAGIAGSKLLPPLLASGSGRLRARIGQDPFALLIEDHRLIQKTLREMEACPTSSHMTRGRLFLRLKRTLGKHAMAEEDVVYPMLQTQAGARDQARQLYEEHGDIKVHLFEIEVLMKQGEDWGERVQSLRNIIEEHIREEEEVEFPRLRQALDQTRSREISGLIRREEALVV